MCFFFFFLVEKMDIEEPKDYKRIELRIERQRLYKFKDGTRTSESPFSSPIKYRATKQSYQKDS